MTTPESPLAHSHAPMLHAMAERLGQPAIRAAARRPGVSGVLRVIAHYYDHRAHDSVATVRRMATGEAALEMAYDHALGGRVLTRALEAERFEACWRDLLGLGFDRMPDQPGLPLYDAADLWLVERAAGGFAHSVLLMPTAQADPHRALVRLIRRALPEMVRELSG